MEVLGLRNRSGPQYLNLSVKHTHTLCPTSLPRFPPSLPLYTPVRLSSLLTGFLFPHGFCSPIPLPYRGSQLDVQSLNLQHFLVLVFIANWQVSFCVCLFKSLRTEHQSRALLAPWNVTSGGTIYAADRDPRPKGRCGLTGGMEYPWCC